MGLVYGKETFNIRKKQIKEKYKEFQDKREIARAERKADAMRARKAKSEGREAARTAYWEEKKKVMVEEARKKAREPSFFQKVISPQAREVEISTKSYPQKRNYKKKKYKKKRNYKRSYGPKRPRQPRPMSDIFGGGNLW